MKQLDMEYTESGLPIVEEKDIKRNITSMGDLLMMLQIEIPIYVKFGKEQISKEDLLKIPFGEVIEMLQTYKLFK